MANTLFITEIGKYAHDQFGGPIPAANMPPVAEQAITIASSSSASAAFNSNTIGVMVHTNAICCLAFAPKGSTPTAVTSAHEMAAGETRFYGVPNGGSLAVIAGS